MIKRYGANVSPCSVVDYSNLINHNYIQVLSFRMYSLLVAGGRDQTCDLQMVSLRISSTEHLYLLRGTIESEFLGLINLMSLSTFEILLP